jgi:hypothetical protein
MSLKDNVRLRTTTASTTRHLHMKLSCVMTDDLPSCTNMYWQNMDLTRVKPGYKDIGLSDTSTDILGY